MDWKEALTEIQEDGIRLGAGDYVGVEALKVAVLALEKQIPKIVLKQTESDREFVDYNCPNCKTTLQQKMKQSKRTTIYKYNHCIFCGQGRSPHGERGLKFVTRKECQQTTDVAPLTGSVD